MEASTTFRVSEIFSSIQGEGSFAGLPVVFVRFAGCDLECSFCDEGGMMGKNPRPDMMTGEDIAVRARELSDQAFPNIVLTGGEPTMHLRDKFTTDALEIALRGCHVAIETNGHFPVPSWVNWITWSPKDDLLHPDVHPNEIKMLMDADGEVYSGLATSAIDEVAHTCQALKFMQALTYEDNEAESDMAIQHALAFINKTRTWRLGQRLHVQLGVK